MATFEQEVRDNLLSLQAQINRIATARLGDVTVGPGEGSLSTVSGSGNITFQAAPDGARAWYRGALAPLTGTLEAKADTSYVNEKDQSLSSQINANDAASRRRDDALSARVDGEADARSKAVSSLSSQINTNDANSRARDNALSSRVGTAQSRADSAYSLADGRATQSQIQSLSSQINNNDASARNRDSALESAVQKLVSRVVELEKRLPPRQA